MSERGEFEKWLNSRIWTTLNQPTEKCKQRMWVGWQAARQSDPTWVNRLNTCKHHGDDHEACAVYGGRVPCDMESEGGEAVPVVWWDGDIGEADTAFQFEPDSIYTIPLYEQQATPQPDKWIACSERLPTEAEAGCDGSVWFTDKSGDGIQMDPILMHWSYVTKGSGHWKPTGLTRPTPPEQESE